MKVTADGILSGFTLLRTIVSCVILFAYACVARTGFADDDWIISVIQESPEAYWVGIANGVDVGHVYCSSSLFYEIDRGPDAYRFGGMVWPASPHLCDPDAGFRHLVLPGQTLYRYAVISHDGFPGGAATLSFLLRGYDYGDASHALGADPAAEIDVKWQDRVRIAKNDNGKLIFGPSERRRPDKSGSLILTIVEVEESKQSDESYYWIGIRNDARFERVISYPEISFEATLASGATTSREVSPLPALFHTPFLVLPGETLFVCPVRRSTAGAISWVRVTLREAIGSPSDEGSWNRRTLTWSKDVH